MLLMEPAAPRIRPASIMSKSLVKPVQRNGDQNTRNARRRGSPDFCLPTSRDMRSRLFTKAMLAALFTAVPRLRQRLPMGSKKVTKARSVLAHPDGVAAGNPQIPAPHPVRDKKQPL